MTRYSLALVVALLLGVFSQLALKRVSVELLPTFVHLPEWYLAGTWLQQIRSSIESLSFWYLLLAVALLTYVLSVGAWIVALQRFSLSRAYPFLSLGYVLVYLIAVCWPGLDESLSWTKSAGIVLVLIGVTLCMRSQSGDNRNDVTSFGKPAGTMQ